MNFEKIAFVSVMFSILAIVCSSQVYLHHKNTIISGAIKGSNNPVLTACAFQVGTEPTTLCAVAISKQ